MTRQEPAGATIAAADSPTYARQPAAFFRRDRAAGVPATRAGAAAHTMPTSGLCRPEPARALGRR
jgi:hypothetical protein